MINLPVTNHREKRETLEITTYNRQFDSFRKMILYVHKLLVKIVQVRSSLLFIAYADQHSNVLTIIHCNKTVPWRGVGKILSRRWIDWPERPLTKSSTKFNIYTLHRA